MSNRAVLGGEMSARQQESQKYQQWKYSDECRVANNATEVSRLHNVCHVFGIFRRAVHPLAVMVAVVSRKKWTRGERHHAGEQIPSGFKDRHLMLS